MNLTLAKDCLPFTKKHEAPRVWCPIKKDYIHPTANMTTSEYPTRAYCIDRDELETLVYKAPANQWYERGLGTLPKGDGFYQLVFDMDAKDMKNVITPITHKDIPKIVSHIQCVLMKRYAKPLVNRPVCVACVVFIREKQIDTGFHLQFPFLFLDKNERREIHDILKNDGYPFDSNVVHNAWQIYGSSKKDKTPYEPIYVCMGEGQITKDVETYIRNQCTVYRMEDECPLNIKDITIPKHEVYRRVFDIWPGGRYETERGNVNCPSRPIPKKQPKIDHEFQAKTDKQKLKECRRLIEKMDPETATDYSSWLAVGMALKNILGDTKQAFRTWRDFSNECLYEEKRCDEDQLLGHWNRMEQRESGGYQIGTLRYYSNYKPEKNKLKN